MKSIAVYCSSSNKVDDIYKAEAKKIAYTLGYNYGSSEWYKNSYKLFNKTYKPIKIDKNNKETGKTHNFLLKKFKSILYLLVFFRVYRQVYA